MGDQSNSDDYEVGYGRPPSKSQFKKGQSGNPRGRPKGSKNFKTVAEEITKGKVTVSSNGKKISISSMEAAFMKLREKALRGDLRALVKFLEFCDRFNSEEFRTMNSDISADDREIIDVAIASRLASYVGDKGEI